MREVENLVRMAPPLMAWYDVHKRTLPWRGEKDPYKIWVSEIMLQQTRVQAVLGYYARFMSKLPTVHDLAAVEEEELLKLWEGLGYYSRARNLRRAAQVIVEQYGGEFPRTAAELKKLPGIGDYTASAIASMAFDEPIAAVDGNLLRVASRVADIRDDIMQEKTKREMRALLNEVIDGARSGEWNQAMMDLGATVCLPNGAPLCEKCPLRRLCAAYRNGMTELLPVRAAKAARRVEERTVLLLFREGKFALRKRPTKGLLASLWEFPNDLGNLDEAGAAIAAAKLGLAAKSAERLESAKHIFTHVEWDMSGWFVEVTGEGENLVWVDGGALERYAVPSAFRAYLAAARQRLEAER